MEDNRWARSTTGARDARVRKGGVQTVGVGGSGGGGERFRERRYDRSLTTLSKRVISLSLILLVCRRMYK